MHRYAVIFNPKKKKEEEEMGTNTFVSKLVYTSNVPHRTTLKFLTDPVYYAAAKPEFSLSRIEPRESVYCNLTKVK